jgi:hypothetical protein
MESQLSVQDIISLMKACRENQVIGLVYGQLTIKIELSAIITAKPVFPEDLAARERQFKSEVENQKWSELEELKIKDPLAYEEAVEKYILQQESPPLEPEAKNAG